MPRRLDSLRSLVLDELYQLLRISLMNSLPPTERTSTYRATSALPLLGAGLRKLLWIGLFVWILGSLGLGWLVKAVGVLVVLLIALPIAGVIFGFWWIRKNIAVGDCPVCGYAVNGVNGSQLECPNCGEALRVENLQFIRLATEGTIDVMAVDVMDVDVMPVRTMDVSAIDVSAQSVD